MQSRESLRMILTIGLLIGVCWAKVTWADPETPVATESSPEVESAAAADDPATSEFLTDTPRPAPILPLPPESLNESIERGVTFLLESQNQDGSWGSATRTKGLNIYAPVPGAHQAFRAAVTGLALSALIQSQDMRPKVTAAIQAGEDWMIENLSRVRRATGDAIYNVWGHAFAMEALVDLLGYGDQSSDRIEKLKEMIASQVEMLDRFESVDGGWGYYDFRAEARTPTSSPTSFTTATGLIALLRAREAGVAVPEKVLQRAAATIRRQQKPDFSYYYSFDPPATAQPMRSINRPGGSLGRSQACNLALRAFGDPKITDEVLNVWLDRLFARNGWLDIGRKRPVPHESHFLVAGYFYYYGHWYAAHVSLARGKRSRTAPGADESSADRLAGTRWQLVGLSVLQLPPAVWHRHGCDDARALPSLMRVVGRRGPHQRSCPRTIGTRTSRPSRSTVKMT